MEGYSDADVAEEKWLSGLSGIILRTPDGHIDDIVSILNNLCRQDKIRKAILEILSRYNKNHILTCNIEGFEHPSLITNFNEIFHDNFCDPFNHRLFHFDHLKKRIVSSIPWESDDVSESWRKAVDAAFSDYIRGHYENGTYGVFGTSKDSVIAVTVCIIKRQCHPKKYHCSCWRSIWTLIISPEVPQALLKGSVQVEGYYADEGRAFLTSENTLETEIRLRDENRTALDMLNVVDHSETTFHNKFMNDIDISGMIKIFRRRLPLCKTSMNWRAVISSGSRNGNVVPENLFFDHN